MNEATQQQQQQLPKIDTLAGIRKAIASVDMNEETQQQQQQQQQLHKIDGLEGIRKAIASVDMKEETQQQQLPKIVEMRDETQQQHLPKVDTLEGIRKAIASVEMSEETQQQQQKLPKIYTLQDIRKAIAREEFETDLMEQIGKGFVALEQGQFYAADIQTLGSPPFPFQTDTPNNNYAAQTCVKSGYFLNSDYYVIKVASGGSPFETNSGLLQVYSQHTGKLEALLLDDGVLTELRTAAVGALVAKLLAPKQVRIIGVLGTGVQARYQLNMLANITDCQHVLVWGRTLSNAQAFQTELRTKGWHVELVKTPNELLEVCDLIVTTTSSRDPILGVDFMDWNKLAGRGVHITCIGSDAPGKSELASSLVEKADLLVADHLVQTTERGEFQQAIAKGLVTLTSILPLGKLVTQSDRHRQASGDNRLTIFDSSGVALQDCVVAEMVYETLKKMGLK
jgi:ornithine cyclodeaminase